MRMFRGPEEGVAHLVRQDAFGSAGTRFNSSLFSRVQATSVRLYPSATTSARAGLGPQADLSGEMPQVVPRLVQRGIPVAVLVKRASGLTISVRMIDSSTSSLRWYEVQL